MGLRNVIASIVMLLAAASSAAAQPSFGGGTGEYRGLYTKDRGTLIGECGSVDFLSGMRPVNTAGSCTLSSTSIVSARDYLSCDGVTDDRARYKTLVEAGGACAGKTCVFDADCTMLWSSCTTGSGDCTVATIAPGTKLIAEPGSNPTVKLAARVCVGGNTPGASCYENGSSDCNGGVCTYDDTTNNLSFAHTASATYTLFKTPATTACTGVGTPWACCTGSGTGVCSSIDQGIAIEGFRIALRQVEDYGRCTNATGPENGKACRGYCSPDAALANFSCSDDSDCVTGTCTNKVLCPDTVGNTSGECDGASRSPAGTGSIVIVDGTGTPDLTVTGMKATDHLKGKGILAGIRATIVSNDLTAVSGFAGAQPGAAFGAALYYPTQVTYGVTVGIQTDSSSVISDNVVRATSFGIDMSNANYGGQFLVTRVRPSVVSNNTVTANSDNVHGIRVAANNATIDNNTVTVTAGDYVFGIRATGNNQTVRANTVTVSPDTDTDGVGVELAGSAQHSVGNAITVNHDTRGTGLRIGSTSCGSFPSCVNGYIGKSVADIVSIGDNGVGVELFGGESSFNGGTLITGASTNIALGQNSQQVVTSSTMLAGINGVVPSNRKYCNTGTNVGKICRQDSTSAATCTGGTCTYDDPGVNYNISNNRIAFQSGIGVGLSTGGLLIGGYTAWNTGRGVVIGDDRVQGGYCSGHASIVGGLIHAFADDVPLITFPDVGNGLCTAADTPWDCCTGNTTGTCNATCQKLVVSGVLLIGSNPGIKALDFGTSFDTNSPDIQEVTFTGNGCYASNTSTVCVNLPSTNQNKITNLTISGNGHTSATYIANWDPAMGTRDDEFVACTTKASLVAADDDYPIFTTSAPVTVTGVSCNCEGTCGGTMAQFGLEDGGGNAMTITGSTPTCSTTGNATWAAVTAGNALQNGETAAFDVTNTPQTGNVYNVCVRYTKP